MKKFTKFCLIFALVLVILGVVCVIGGFASGATRATLRSYHLWEYDFLDLDENEIDDAVSIGDFQTSKQEISAQENIREIRIDVKAADVTFDTTDSAAEKIPEGTILVETRVRENLQKIEISIEEGVLYISEKTESGLIEKYLNNLGDNCAKVKIYLPKTLVPDLVEIESGVGDLSAQDNLEIRKLTAQLGVGDIRFSGKVRILESMNISSGVGDIKLDDIDCQGDLETYSGVGDLSVYGTVTGNMTSESGTGDMEIYLKGDKDSYNYDISNGTGEMEINGHEYEGVSHEYQVTNNPGGSTITLDGGVGDIELFIDR